MEVLLLAAHNGPIDCLRFSPDGERLISIGDDGLLRIWSGCFATRKRMSTEFVRPSALID
jgi:WD40 repeat protein